MEKHFLLSTLNGTQGGIFRSYPSIKHNMSDRILRSVINSNQESHKRKTKKTTRMPSANTTVATTTPKRKRALVENEEEGRGGEEGEEDMVRFAQLAPPPKKAKSNAGLKRDLATLEKFSDCRTQMIEHLRQTITALSAYQAVVQDDRMAARTKSTKNTLLKSMGALSHRIAVLDEMTDDFLANIK